MIIIKNGLDAGKNWLKILLTLQGVFVKLVKLSRVIDK